LLSRLLGSAALAAGLRLSGVRLALWTVGIIIAGAGVLSLLSLRDGNDVVATAP